MGGIPHKNIYMYYLKSILAKGGDTDTNAAIVGGMLGAVVGIRQMYELNEHQISTLLRFNPLTSMRPRPKRYAASEVFKLLPELLKRIRNTHNFNNLN